MANTGDNLSRAIVSAQVALLTSAGAGSLAGWVGAVGFGETGGTLFGLVVGFGVFAVLAVRHDDRERRARDRRSNPPLNEPEDRPNRITRDPDKDGFTVWAFDSRDVPVECVATYDGTWPTVPWRLTPVDPALRADWWVDDLFAETDWFDRPQDAAREERVRRMHMEIMWGESLT